MSIAVGQAVAGLVDEIAAGFGRNAGEALTPVSITATVTPAPVANLWASATPM